MIKLHNYQQDLVNRVYDAWETVRAVLMVLATGGGKTFIFSWILHDHKGASAVVVHRKEILSQISCSLAKLGVRHRVVAPDNVIRLIRRKHLEQFGKSFIDPHALCGVASAQTLISASTKRNTAVQAWLRQVTLAVFDEGHHYTVHGQWAEAVEVMGDAKLLFVTATPDRADGKGLGAHADGFAEVMIEGPQTQWLTDHGFLSPFKYFAPTSDLDVSGLAVTASGDFNAKALRQRVVESHLVGDVVSQWLQFAPGQQTIVFVTDVATAEEQAVAFRAAGVAAEALNGKTDAKTREQALRRFEDGTTLVLVNVDLFDEGFDVPAATCAVIARPTQSLAKYLQMVGRVLRYLKDKTASIIDPVRNWERQGMPNWPRVWSLNGREKGSRGAADDLIKQRVCVQCTQPYEAFYTACPYCGAVPVPAGRSVPEQVDGDLMELDVAGMQALFAAMNDADLDDDEYALDQLARGIPRVGRGADMKRHRAAKYRRQVLRELVGWWIGLQGDERPLNEKHRRFFHRFGIDIGTAFTLNAKDTDALKQRIERDFAKDMTA